MDKMELSRKLEQLAALAASRENRLEMTEVLDAFKELQVTPEEMEDVYRKLERKGVQIQVPEEGEETLPDSDLILEDDLALEDGGMVKEDFRWKRQRKRLSGEQRKANSTYPSTEGPEAIRSRP